MPIDCLPRFPLAFLPTPVEELKALSRLLGGPEILIKRDDQTGLALGGNKTRKLEFLVGDALARGADTLVTLGAAQSNHCRQTAAAAAKAGLRCELVLNGNKPGMANGNLLLDELLGAGLHWIERSQRQEKVNELEKAMRAQGRKPYIIPVGGSNGIGATGYVLAMQEVAVQLDLMKRRVDHIFFATSSGGTQAGIVLGARLSGVTSRLHGLSIDKNDPECFEYETEVAMIAADCARYLGSPIQVKREEIAVIYGYKGEGYGVVGDLERDAIRLLARSEGIVLDPVYAGRGSGAMVDLIRRGRFRKNETVLFWHTGGAPALFAHAAEVT